jgi:intracellular sulfur oxidation DsrE/DsrF family protein
VSEQRRRRAIHAARRSKETLMAYTSIRWLVIVLVVLLASPPVAYAAEGETRSHRLAIQVDTDDAATMNLALANAANVSQYYSGNGEEIEIEIVTYGPGVHMLRSDTSPVKARIQAFAEGMPNVSFTACGNTLDAMRKAEQKPIPLMPDVSIVPAGVVRLIELQERGWSYVRP